VRAAAAGLAAARLNVARCVLRAQVTELGDHDRAVRGSPRTVRCFRLLLALIVSMLSGCEPTAIVGVYSDAGGRCDPLGTSCETGTACALRSDPAMDACRPVGGASVGAPCTALDACEPGAQCAAIEDGTATLEPADLAAATCAAICARDSPECAVGRACVGIRSSEGIRIDYGICAP
jgi:hypothetical protein